MRPPPGKSNHPLNLQVQLVPPQTPQVKYKTAYASSAETLVSTYDTSSTTSTLVSERENGTRRRIVPLYNLHAHNVMTNTITDAGTDAKIARFQKKGIELVDLAVLEPVEVWGERSESGKRQAKDRAMWIALDDTGSVVLRPPNPSSKQDPLAPRLSENPFTNLPSQPQPDDPPPPYQQQAQSPASFTPKTPTLHTEHNKLPPPTGSSNAAAPQLLKRFSEVRRWFSTNKGPSPHGVDQRMGEVPEVRLIAGDAGQTIQERRTASVTKVPSRPGDTDTGAVHPSSGAVVNSSPVEDSTPQWRLRPPILGTQAISLSASRRQAGEPVDVDLGLEIIGGDGNVLIGGKRPATVQSALLSTGKGNKVLNAESIFDGASVVSGTSSMTLVESTFEDFAAQDQASGNERAELYVWLAVKWLKKRSDPPRPSKWNLQSGSTFGLRVGGSFDVRFEWARAKAKARTSGRVGGKNMQALVAGYEGDDDEGDQHPEDSEAAWVCTLKIRKVGDAQSHSPASAGVDGRATHTPLEIAGDSATTRRSGGDSSRDGEKETTLRLKVGVLSPTLHHPKVVAMLKIPYPLPDVEVEQMTFVKRQGLSGQSGVGRGDNNKPYLGLTLSAEEIKDVVCCTGLWLVVRETMRGVGKGVRKGDRQDSGWRYDALSSSNII